MENPALKKRNENSRFIKPAVIVLTVLLAGAAIYGATALLARMKKSAGFETPSYKVEKKLMRVTVTAGGTLQAMRSHDVQSQVEGSTQILSIIPEGTIITRDDVEKGIVLMELDASQAREKLDQQKITVQDASAADTQAREDYNIQKEQNESDISQAKLSVRFALMELERYLGEELASRAIEGNLDFESADWQNDIRGASLQERRNLENSVSLAGEELSRTRESLHWTRTLVEQGYVNRNELVADELQKKRRLVELERAEAELELFLRYTLLKETEERLSDYIEARRSLQRTQARARGRLAQAEANLRSREASYRLQKERLEKLYAMIENSTVKAGRPGLVVYASTTNPRQFRNSPVQEGLSVREGQTILSIPDLSTLAARVEVPETHAQIVRAGLSAEITLDAMPDEIWAGEVRRISPMATQQWGMRALAGGSSGYETDVAFLDLGHNDKAELKPGMSATVEIEITRIPYALSVPIYAIHTMDGKRMCWVAMQDGPELREVQLGYYTDTHVEIRQGLQEGEQVLLSRPERIPRDIRIVTLPEKAPDTEKTEPQESATPFPENRGDTDIEYLLRDIEPEMRKRIEERMQDPEAQERIMKRLADPDARERMLERMRNQRGGERPREGNVTREQ